MMDVWDYPNSRLLSVIASALECEVLPHVESDTARSTLQMARVLLDELATEPDLVRERDESAIMSALGLARVLGLDEEALDARSEGPWPSSHEGRRKRRHELLAHISDRRRAGAGESLTYDQLFGPELALMDIPGLPSPDRQGEDERLSPTPSLEDFQAALEGWPDASGEVVTSAARLGMGSSKDTFAVTMRGDIGSRRVVVRRDLPNGPVPQTVADEFVLLESLHGLGLAVPRVRWLAGAGSALHHPFIVMDELEGQVAAEIVGGRLCIRHSDGELAGRELARLLAQLHAIDARRLGSLDKEAPGQREAIRSKLNAMEAMWHEIAPSTPSVILSETFAWLHAHVPDRAAPSALVHGDASLRNLYMGRRGAVALLDWESAHLGSPMEDLAYARVDIEAVMDWRDFLQHYEAHGGLPYDDDVTPYFTVWQLTQWVVWAMRAGQQFAHTGDVDLRMADIGARRARRYLGRLANELIRLGDRAQPAERTGSEGQ